MHDANINETLWLEKKERRCSASAPAPPTDACCACRKERIMHDPWINYETPCWHNPWRLCPSCQSFLEEKREYWVGRWVVEQTWGSQQTRDRAREYRDFFPPLAENTEDEWL